MQWRSLLPVFAIGLPIVAGLALVYLFVSGIIGMATVLVSCFALGAFAITAAVLHIGAEEDPESTRWGSP
jgi:hypothetical protein